MIISNPDLSRRETIEEFLRFPIYYSFVFVGRFVPSPWNKPVKTTDELVVGDEVATMGFVHDKKPALYEDWYEGTSGEGWRLTFLDVVDGKSRLWNDVFAADETFAIGPETAWEKVYSFGQRWGSFFGQRRRSGRVVYYVGPVDVMCYREGFKVRLQWIGFSRFRKS